MVLYLSWKLFPILLLLATFRLLPFIMPFHKTLIGILPKYSDSALQLCISLHTLLIPSLWDKLEYQNKTDTRKENCRPISLMNKVANIHNKLLAHHFPQYIKRIIHWVAQWLSVLPLVQGMILASWDGVPHWACIGNLLLFLPMSLPLYGSLINNKIFKINKRIIHQDQVFFPLKMQRYFNICKSLNVMHHIKIKDIKKKNLEDQACIVFSVIYKNFAYCPQVACGSCMLCN